MINWIRKLFKIRPDVYFFAPHYEQALVKEWTNAIQLVCPYCEKCQIESTAADVMLSPPDYWNCEFCQRKFRVKASCKCPSCITKKLIKL